MMGSFDAEPPPAAAAVTSLERLLAWKLRINGIDPLSTTVMTAGETEKFVKGVPVPFPVIAGHRQANYTICPGNAFFRILPGIRNAVAGTDLPRIYDFAVSSSTISPNGDGVLDSVKVTYTISEAADWRVELRRPGGAVVRTFSGSGSTAAVAWGGRGKNGSVVPDGSYTLAASATSASGAAPIVTATIVVDTVAPTFVSSRLRSPLFSPNGDGIADLAKVDFATSESLSGRLQVKARDGSVIRSYAWTSLNAGKHTFAWDGAGMLDGISAPAPNGSYGLTIHVKDGAGNHATVSYPMRLDRALRYPAMRPAWFSPNRDGRADTAVLTFRLFSPAAVTVRIAGDRGTVRRFTLGSLPKGTQGVSWNGRARMGTLVLDGTYRFTAIARTPSGAVSVEARVTKDTTRPVLSTPSSVSTTLGGTAKVTYAARDAYSTLAYVTATLRGPSGAIERTPSFGWVRTGQRYLWAVKLPNAGPSTITFRAQDQARNSAVPVVTIVTVK